MDPVQNEKGEWVIPASRRPDGTWRKEKVLKEGYVPPDEVKAFATRASKNVKKGIPGLPPPVERAEVKAPPKATVKKEAAKPMEVTKAEHVVAESLSALSVSAGPRGESSQEDGAKDPAKRLKALKKKLREISEIESKPQGALTPEQIEKMSKKDAIVAEIGSLAEYDK